MTDKRRELINALIGGLGINKDAYAIDTLKEKTELLKESQYLDFYQEVMKENSFGNGIKAVLNVLDRFCPAPLEQITDATTAEAKRLISACETMNTILFKECNNIGIPLEDYVMNYEFNNLQDSTKALLNAVKPYNNYKQLIINIRVGWTSFGQIEAFKRAIDYAAKNNQQLTIGRTYCLVKKI